MVLTIVLATEQWKFSLPENDQYFKEFDWKNVLSFFIFFSLK
jgi:hypothetical protein